MSAPLTSLPNVSAPDVPCGSGWTAVWIEDPSTLPGREGEPPEWLCFSISECPAGTSLYVSPGPVEWRVCTSNVPALEALHGPNAATSPLVATPVPSLSEWAVIVLVAALAVIGAWRAR